MVQLAPVDPTRLHAAFLEAFADYAMGSAADLPEARLLLRMKKNAVDYALSVGAYEGDRLVGFTLVGIDRWGGALTAYDAGTGIVPAFRGQGLARRMLDHAIPPLRERGVERFLLEVLASNEPAIKAYTKAGFATRRDLRSFVANAPALAATTGGPFVLRPIDEAAWASLAEEMDWLPSFENRISAVRALEGAVSLVGAFDGAKCVGAYAYCPALRWLLSLVVARAHRRRGVGRALVTHAASALPEGVTRLAALNVDGADRGTQQFFERLGFAVLVDQYEMERAIP